MAEKKGKKNGKNAILMAVLIPIMIIVLIASSFFAITEGIIKIIEGIVTSIIEFLKHPWQSIQIAFATVSNWLSSLLNIDSFDVNEYLKYRVNPTIVIGEEHFNQMKEALEKVVNMDATGLDDVTIKKMLLAYYRSVYLNDTNILIALTNEEYQNIANNNIKASPFEVIWGNEDEGLGKNGVIYLKTKGIIYLKYIGGTSDSDILYYYTPEGLKQIYEQKYIANINNNKTDTADAVKDYLKKCYTFDGGEMKMYAFSETTITNSYYYGNDNDIHGELISSTGSANLVTIDFSIDIQQYTTPIEFFVDLMEITGSRDFINSFMEMLSEEEKIVLQLYEITNKDKTEIAKEYTQDTAVTGKKDDIIYTVKRSDGSADGLKVTEEPVDGKPEFVNIKVVDELNKGLKFVLCINGLEDGYNVSAHGYTARAINYVDLNKDNTYEWSNRSKPNQTEKVKNDNSKVTVSTKTTVREAKYEVGIKSVDVWYAKIETQGIQKIDDVKYYMENANGELNEIKDPNDLEKQSLVDETVEYLKNNNPEYFNEDYKKETNNGEVGFTNSIYNYVIRKSENDYKYQDYDFNQIKINKSAITQSKLTTKSTGRLVPGVRTMTDKTDIFLGLLSNDTGIYTKGAAFKAKSAGGKVVIYPDLYKSTTGAGELLENGAEVLFELLDRSEHTRSMVDLMKYIMYKYSGINYGITNFEQFSNMLNPNWNEFGSQVVAGNSVEERVWYTLIAQGYSETATAGIMGNIYGESGFNPAAIESNGEGHGLCQWSYGRKQQLMQYAQSKGKDWTDVEIQIEFLLGELNKNGGADGYATYQMAGTHYSYTYDSWYNATDIDTATKAFMAVFERPNMNLAHTDKRIKAAQQYYDTYHGKARNGGEYVQVNTAGIIGRFTSSITGRTFTIYKQNSPEIALPRGCNRVAAASIASGYRKGTEMEVIADVKTLQEYVLSTESITTNFFSRYGLKAEVNKCAYSMENIRQIISRGGYIALYFVNGPVYGKSGAQYAGEIHWIAILGYRNSENGEEIFVSDSGWGSSGWKSIDEFENYKSHIRYFTTVHE